jgi:diguanylate cyclase (GGDEF)-like protein
VGEQVEDDLLTGLPGPSRLADLLAAADEVRGLVLLDIDGFHAHNRTHGHDAGDRLLRAVAAGLVEAAPEGAHILRLSGDEFAAIVPCADEADLLIEGRALAASVTELAPSVSASCGVAIVDGDARGSVRRAGLALAAARRAGPGRVHGVPDAGAPLSSVEQDDLDVRTALRLGDYELHFQPLVVPSSATTTTPATPVGVEALVRWRRDASELLSPGVFLPTVRRAGLAAEFGANVLADALGHWVGTLRSALVGGNGGEVHAPLLAVNVDVEQAEQDGFDELVLHLLRRATVPPEELVIEVTEAVLAEPAAAERLRCLRAAGVHVAIDDFGAGPVVLSEVRELPVDIIKVDQVLVSRLDPSAPDMGLIDDLSQLAGMLGLTLSVEAVESAALAERIAALGVPLAQGYHYARPMPPPEAVVWLRGGWRRGPGAATPGARGGEGVATPDV